MKNRINRFLTGIVVIFSLTTFHSCSKDDDNEPTNNPGANEVWMQNTAFNPSTITVALNTTIVWTNKDNMNHTATADSGSFNSGTVASGGTFSHQFTTKGTFDYHCNFHSGMKGKVVVN